MGNCILMGQTSGITPNGEKINKIRKSLGADIKKGDFLTNIIPVFSFADNTNNWIDICENIGCILVIRCPSNYSKASIYCYDLNTRALLWEKHDILSNPFNLTASFKKAGIELNHTNNFIYTPYGSFKITREEISAAHQSTYKNNTPDNCFNDFVISYNDSNQITWTSANNWPGTAPITVNYTDAVINNILSLEDNYFLINYNTLVKIEKNELKILNKNESLGLDGNSATWIPKSKKLFAINSDGVFQIINYSDDVLTVEKTEMLDYNIPTTLKKGIFYNGFSSSLELDCIAQNKTNKEFSHIIFDSNGEIIITPSNSKNIRGLAIRGCLITSKMVWTAYKTYHYLYSLDSLNTPYYFRGIGSISDNASILIAAKNCSSDQEGEAYRAPNNYSA